MEDPDFEQAVEYDLIQSGLRLRWLCDGTDRLNWRDLLVIIRQSGRETAVVRSEYGEMIEWGVGEYLLAGVLDGVNGLSWQGGGGKGPKPKPIPRPEDTRTIDHREDQSSSGVAGNTQMFAGDGFEMDSLTIDEMNDWLGMAPLPS